MEATRAKDSPGRPRRVLMSADTIGGVWTYAVELAGGLSEAGVQVVLAAMGAEPSARQREQAESIDGLELHARPFALEWMQEPWRDLERAGYWLAGLAERYAPQLVHLNTLAHGTLSWPAPLLSVGHSCVLSWFEAVRGEAAPAEWERYQRLVEASLQASDAVAAPSRAMLAALERHYGPFETARAIHNGRRGELFAPAAKEPVVLSAGRLWDDAKNVGALAEASAQIDWPVYVAGSQEHPDGGSVELDGVRLLGRLEPEQLADWYARASIYALPARYEPFGLTALEAALSGCALVLGDIPSLREVWGEAAVFVDPDNPAELSRQVGALAADPARRERLVARSSRRARQLSTEAMTAAYLELYRELISPTRVARTQGSWADGGS